MSYDMDAEPDYRHILDSGRRIAQWRLQRFRDIGYLVDEDDDHQDDDTTRRDD